MKSAGDKPPPYGLINACVVYHQCTALHIITSRCVYHHAFACISSTAGCISSRPACIKILGGVSVFGAFSCKIVSLFLRCALKFRRFLFHLQRPYFVTFARVPIFFLTYYFLYDTIMGEKNIYKGVYMQEKKTKILHLIYGIVLSVLIFAVGICFIVSCVDINNAGKFTVDAIKTHFLWILAPVLLCIFSIIGGAVLHAVFPPSEEKIKASMSNKDLIKNLYKKIDLDAAPAELKAVIKSQRGFRHAFFIIMIVNAVINFVSAFVFIFTKSNLGEVDPGKLNEILPVIGKILAYAIIPFFSSYTYERELEAVRAIMESQTKKRKKGELNLPEEKKVCFFKKHSKKFILALQITLGVVAAAFIIVGIITGDIKNVLTYANNICTGCIGLG